MGRFKRFLMNCCLGLSLSLLAALSVHGQDSFPSAPITDDQGGPTLIVGSAISADDVPAPRVVALIDQGPHLLGLDDEWVSESGQILGRFTSPASTSPFSYTVSLPIMPTGIKVDVDNDGENDAGVQIYRLVIGEDLIGDSYLQFMEQDAALASTTVDPFTGNTLAGTLLVFAEDDEQGFPTGSGADGIFFSADDPIGGLPAGYTLVTVGAEEVTLDRPRTAVMDVVSAPSGMTMDLSEDEIEVSFESLIDLLAERYAYSDLRGLDWEELRSTYQPAVSAAADEDDLAAYFLVLHELAQSIVDFQVQAIPGRQPDSDVAEVYANLLARKQANVGLRPVELDDGRVIVSEVVPQSPADRAGITVGAELLAVDGLPMDEAIAAATYVGFPGSSQGRRLMQIDNLLKFATGDEVTIDYRLSGSDELLTSALTAGSYRLGPSFTVAQNPMPAAYRFLNSYGYLAIPAFARQAAALAVVEDFLKQANRRAVDSLLIDLRGNPGGSISMMNLLAAYLFSAQRPLHLDGIDSYRYDAASGNYIQLPGRVAPIHAPDSSAHYDGSVALLVDNGCGGACEAMAELLQRTGRVSVVGQYGTAGGAGAITQVNLPGGIVFSYTSARELLAGTNESPIEGQGVEPDVRVPVSEVTELAKLERQDPVLDAAIAHLNDQQLVPVEVEFPRVGVASLGPQGWRLDEQSGQLGRADGTGILIFTERDDDVDGAVQALVERLDGSGEYRDEATLGERVWRFYDGSLFGRNATIAGSTIDATTYLVTLFLGDPDQVELLEREVLAPMLENFRLIQPADRTAPAAATGDATPLGDVSIEFRLGDQTAEDDLLPYTVGASDTTVYLGAEPVLTNEDVDLAEIIEGSDGSQLHMVLNDAGRRKLAEVTGNNLGKILALLLDGQVVAAPVIQEVIESGELVVPGALPE